MKSRLFLIAAGALVLASLACSSEPSATAQNPPTEQAATAAPATQKPSGGNTSGITITSVTMYRDNGSGEPGDEVTVFQPADHVMHFLAKADGLQSGQNVKLVFTAVDTTEGRDLKVAEAETGKLFVADQITGQVSLDRDWPVGSYKLEFYVDGDLIYTWDYEVKE